MPEYVPTWRRPGKARRRAWLRPVFRTISFLAIALLWLPWNVNVPISNQLSQSRWEAWLMIGLCAALMVALIGRMLKIERYVSALLLSGVLAMVGYIGFSDPYSIDHLFVFLAVSLLLSGWMAWMAWELEDGLLKILAAGAAGAFAFSFFKLGLGERLLVTSALLAANELFLEHFDE